MQSKDHWERVYATKASNQVSWFQAHSEYSLKFIRETGVPSNAAIIDVGGGASTLIDDLLTLGYENVTVLDLSGAALNAAKTRLGKRASSVHWLEGDIIETELPAYTFDVWHDRAVFHFLATDEERKAYVEKMSHSVKPGGIVIMATFAEDGPVMCSGLPVTRYSANTLRVQLGASFLPLGHEKESHRTPAGAEQKFLYCLFQMTSH